MTLLMALDLETTGSRDVFSDRILLLSVVMSDGREYIFEDCPDWVLQAVTDKDVIKLIHNAAFDLKLLQHNFGVVAENVWDTLAVERLLTSGKGLGCKLSDVVFRRLDKYMDKSVRKNFGLGIMGDREKEYCLEDSRVLLPIYRQQKEEIETNGQQKAAELENQMSIIVSDMELTGVGFDLPLWNKLYVIMQDKRNEVEQKVLEALGVSCSIDLFGGFSNKSVSLTQRDKMLILLKEQGIVLADYQSGTLQEYTHTNAGNGAQIVSDILEFKQWDRALGWSYPDDVHPITGRIHPHYNPQGADTFRFTSNKPNMQQVSAPFSDEVNFRHLFYALKGRKIVGADYNQIEFRALADQTGGKALIKAFNEGLDLHALTAEMVLGRKLKDKTERTLGKVINFGVAAYGGGVPALTRTALNYGLFLSERQANKYLRAIRKKNVTVENWGKRVTARMARKGYIQTAIGHRRWLEGEDRESVARNTEIQMLAAGIIKDAMYPLFLRLRKDFTNAKIVLQVHDELMIECEEGEAPDVEKVLVEEMKHAGERWLKQVPVEVDSYVSQTWEK